MNEEKLDILSLEIRSCEKCKKENIINLPQPGFFNSKTILLIFQNPSYPRVDKWQDDAMQNRLLTPDRLRDIYISTLKESALGNFIHSLHLNFEDISITNIIKCPTKDNEIPHKECLFNCYNYLIRQIDILEPKLIILNGMLTIKNLSHLEKRYKVLKFEHYASLMRKGILKEKMEEYRIKIIERLEGKQNEKADMQKSFA